MLLSSAYFYLVIFCSVHLTNVQLQVVFRVVEVLEVQFALAALDVRGRLAVRAEELK
jgi:hypothetical protein